MKQPNFKRKAFSLLIVPFALGAFPLSAEIPVATNYDGYSEIFEITDADNNRLFFYSPLWSNEARYIGAETENTHITLPESFNKRVNEEWEEEPVYEECIVNGFTINDDWSYIVNPLGWASQLNDITLTDNITSVDVRPVGDYRAINIHFTSDNVPENVNIEGLAVGYTLTGRIPISVPAAALDAYKAALDENTCMVIAEGTDPKEAFEKELASVKGLRMIDDYDCVPYAYYSATDDNGTLFAFETYDGYITLRGIITKETSVTVPENVYCSVPEWYAFMSYPVVRCCLDYYNEDNTGFPGSSNLTDVYMPSGLFYAEFNGSGYNNRINFHLSSPEVPELCMYSESAGYVNLYVPDALFMDYANYLGDNDYVLRSENPATPVTVNVATPGTLAEQILSVMDDLGNVRWLVVTGAPNEIDMRTIRRLPRLETLDLSGVTGLTKILGCNNLRFLSEVKLPSGVEEIGESAFSKCRSLKNIEIPSSVTKIDRNAFEYTSITSVNLENVERIEYEAFWQARQLKSVTFGKNLTYIGGEAFADCDLQGTLEFPENLTTVDWGAFNSNYNLKKVILNKNLTNISEGSFQGLHLDAVECHMLFPHNENIFRYTDVSNTILYVPALTLNEYLLHDKWIDFTVIEPLPDDLTELTINREFNLTSDKGIADKAKMDMKESGHLTVNRKADLNLSKYSQFGDYDYGEYYNENQGWVYGNFYNGATIIPESTVTADNVDIKLRLHTDRWTFLSFPFDINVKDIVVDADALWVVRKYSGEARANLEENTWQNMTDETVLKAGEGYIFNCAAEGRSDVNFTFYPASNGNGLFAKGGVEKTLSSYPSEFAHNASWNLAGNSYPAYLNIKGVEFDAPITVWHQGSYYAYSTLDDEFVLEPFQAFFVQCQDVDGGNVIKLNPAARAHSRKAAAELNVNRAARAPRINADRALFNIHINGENGSDRTRIVINEEASSSYESNRDASKFMSTMDIVPQIFVNNSGIRMAIDETPIGNGEFTLGARFGKKGEYKVSLDTRNAEDYRVVLIDNETGVSTDLTATDYVFDADASLNDHRFTLAFSSTNGVDSAVAEDLEVNVEGNILTISGNSAIEITVVAIDGKTIASAVSNDFTATLENGIYIVKAGQKTMKIKVGK